MSPLLTSAEKNVYLKGLMCELDRELISQIANCGTLTIYS